ncbi:MAG: hypothetical protein R2876_00360 [Eubacteriales bacterium]
MQYIPSEDKNSVYCIGVGSSYYLRNSILPAYRQFLLETYININPAEAIMFEEYLINNPIKWLITKGPIDQHTLLTSDTISFIKNNYIIVTADSEGRMLYNYVGNGS